MTPLLALNVLSNLIIFSSIFMFVISVFGRADHPIWETKYRAYLAKAGLCISGCGALLNVLTLSAPTQTEIILNVGLSLNFCWLSWWQYGESKKRKQVLAQKTKLKPKRKPRATK